MKGVNITCIRLNLSCPVNPCTPIKTKIGGKTFSQKHAKTSFLLSLFNSVKFLLRPKNQWVALVDFKLSMALKYLKKEGMAYHQA